MHEALFSFGGHSGRPGAITVEGSLLVTGGQGALTEGRLVGTTPRAVKLTEELRSLWIFLSTGNSF